MGCVHTHQGRPAIEKCDNLSYIRNVVEKFGEDNQKVRKINRIISQLAPTLGPKHDIIKA